MKAYVLHGIDDLRYENIKKPKLKDNEVLVNVKACGICGSDIPRIYTTGAHVTPLIPGHEFSGLVTEVGDKVDPLWLNKRVGVFPLIPCRQCEMCKKGIYELCRNYSYLGSRANGGFAEFCAVPVSNLIELPDNVLYEEAAMLEPMAVAVHAIRRALLNKDDKIVICGLGTIGMFVLMFLLEQGIKNIFAIGNKEFQKKNVIDLGINEDNYCDANTLDVNKWVNEKTGGGANVFFECVGKNETIKLAVNSTAPTGQIVFVGNPCSDICFEKATYWKILRNELTVTGSWNSSFNNTESDDWHYVIDRLNKIKPLNFISHKFSIDELEKGIHIIRDKSEDYMKILMDCTL